MRKKFTIFLILIFVLGLTPINFSTAITQNQIDAEVQIVCTDGAGNWSSGSGTIIDPKGIILTNRHIIEGAYMDTCFIGFIDSISQEPNFGTAGNYNLAEIKYYTTTDSMDAAILYLDNPTNKIYPYINIWDSNSDSLQFGNKVEAIGFPSIGGSTITYTSGDFSGFGSNSDGTQNYIKSTAQLEHGNSGGAAYNSKGEFIGIPTMVVVGTLNSLSYILTVNSIKGWLLGKLGQQYKEEIIEQKPVVQKPKIIIQNDITPPDINKISWLAYRIFNDNMESLGGGMSMSDRGKVERYNHVQFELFDSQINEMDINGLRKIYYYFDKRPRSILDNNATEYILFSLNDVGSEFSISKIIDIEKPGSYYFTFFAEDGAGNISNPYIHEYVYEPEIFKSMSNIYFYRNNTLKSYIKGYDVEVNENNYSGQIQSWKFGAPRFAPLQCYTRLNNLTLLWEYPKTYNNYIVKSYNSWDPLIVITAAGESTFENKYTFSNISKGNIVTWHEKMDTGSPAHNNIYYEFYLKPSIAGPELEKKHILLKLIYNPALSEDLICDELTYYGERVYTENNQKPALTQSKEEILKIINRLKGKILLQVEAHGEAYYVYPKDSKRYYMADGNEAYRIMRYLGVGITNKDLDRVMADKSFAKKHSGKIFLQVEAHGEAYYIDFDGEEHYLKDGSAAYNIMRDLGLGITNNDLNKIPEGNL